MAYTYSELVKLAEIVAIQLLTKARGTLIAHAIPPAFLNGRVCVRVCVCVCVCVYLNGRVCVVYVCVYVYARTASHVFSLPAQNAAHRPLLVVVGGGWGRAVVGMDGPCHGVTVVEMGGKA